MDNTEDIHRYTMKAWLAHQLRQWIYANNKLELEPAWNSNFHECLVRIFEMPEILHEDESANENLIQIEF
jgi:hypothetical protein